MVLPVSAVVLDLGGVVIRICRSWQEAAIVSGVVNEGHHWPDAAMPALESIGLDLQRGAIDEHQFLAAVVAALSGNVTVDAVRRAQRAWLKEAEPGVAELVTALKRRGLATAILSNTSPDHWRHLATLPAVRGCQHHFLSFELKLMKPTPAIFQHVAARLGVPPREILFFDDTLVNVQAAHASGWQAVHVDHAKPAAPQLLTALARLAPGLTLSLASTVPDA